MASGTLVFLIIGGIGIALLIVSLFGLEFFEIGSGEGGISMEAVAGFAGALGFGAAIANELIGGSSPVLVAAAAGIGLLAAVPTAGFRAPARPGRGPDMRTDATPTRNDLVGALGVVVTPIPADGYGEVRVRVGGQPVKLNAKADSPIPLGTQRLRRRGPQRHQRAGRADHPPHPIRKLDAPLVIAIGGAVVLLLILVLFVLSRIKVAGPNEAFIVTGRKGRTTQTADGVRSTDNSGQKVVMGASVFVLPVVQKLQSLDLSSRRIHVEIQGAVSKQGIRANLQGVAIVKVGGTEDAIRAAAQRFLHQQDEIEEFTREVLAGALRSIVGRLTIEEIIRDRAAFASAVAEEAEHSMTNQGLVLDTFQLQDILAEGSYLQDLGRPEAARVLKDAAIAEARARQAAEQERLLAEEAIAEANRNLSLKQAGIQAEIDAAKAKSAAAGPLAQAERDQAILSEQQKVAERNAELKQRQLDTEVRKPADAARYKVEQEAEAARNAAVLDRRRAAPGHHRRRAGHRRAGPADR